jgi:hypothetical protein
VGATLTVLPVVCKMGVTRVFNDIKRVLQGCYKCVTRVPQGWYTHVVRVLPANTVRPVSTV